MFALLLVLSSPPPTDPREIVQRALIEPLAQKESARSKFSRAYRPPRLRTVRMLEAHKDFVSFAIDETFGGTREAMVGCVYPKSEAVFIKRGESYLPAAFLLGKGKDKAPAGVCMDPSA